MGKSKLLYMRDQMANIHQTAVEAFLVHINLCYRNKHQSRLNISVSVLKCFKHELSKLSCSKFSCSADLNSHKYRTASKNSIGQPNEVYVLYTWQLLEDISLFLQFMTSTLIGHSSIS